MTDKRSQLEAVAAAAAAAAAAAQGAAVADTRSQRCASCGYSLVGLGPGAACPECGAPPGASVVSFPLGDVGPQVLVRIAAGARFAGLAGIGLGVWGLVTLVLVIAEGSAWGRLPLFAHPIVGGVLAGAAALGLWVFASTPAPAGLRRWSAATTAAVLVALLALWMAGVEGGSLAILGCVAALGLAVAAFASVACGGSLVARIPDWKLTTLMGDLQFALPLVAVVGMCAFIGPAIAAIIWGGAMLKLSARLRSAAGDASAGA